jgi:hypothetical protein
MHVRRFPLGKVAALLLGGLYSGVLAGGLAACEGYNPFASTPMPNEQNCQYVPDIEFCKSEADKITETCLHDCVIDLCKHAKIVCDADAAAECAKTSPADPPGGSKVGFVVPHGQTCLEPWNEIGWCQRNISADCQTKNMVHELAHACGWHHDGGLGVPGNNGVVSCNK